MLVSDSFAKDAILAWFRGEFAAANAIIDALCAHLSSAAASSAHDYDAVFAAIHRRRLNWIPVLQMQKYHSIADVTLELARLADRNHNSAAAEHETDDKTTPSESVGNGGGGDEHEEYESPESEITDSGK